MAAAAHRFGRKSSTQALWPRVGHRLIASPCGVLARGRGDNFWVPHLRNCSPVPRSHQDLLIHLQSVGWWERLQLLTNIIYQFSSSSHLLLFFPPKLEKCLAEQFTYLMVFLQLVMATIVTMRGREAEKAGASYTQRCIQKYAHTMYWVCWQMNLRGI